MVLATTVVAGINEDQLGELVDFGLRNSDIVCRPLCNRLSSRAASPYRLKGISSTGDMVNLVAEQTGGRIARAIFGRSAAATPAVPVLRIWWAMLTHASLSPGPSTGRRTGLFQPDQPQGATLCQYLAQMHGGVLPRGLPVLIMGLMDAWIMDLNKLAAVQPDCGHSPWRLDSVLRLSPHRCRRTAPVSGGTRKDPNSRLISGAEEGRGFGRIPDHQEGVRCKAPRSDELRRIEPYAATRSERLPDAGRKATPQMMTLRKQG